MTKCGYATTLLALACGIIVALISGILLVGSPRRQAESYAGAAEEAKYTVKEVVANEVLLIRINIENALYDDSNSAGIFAAAIKSISNDYNIRSITPITAVGRFGDGSTTYALLLLIEPKMH